MRIVFTCVAGSVQHFSCLLPLARAADAAGDDVVVASGPDRAAQVAAAGFRFHPVGLDFADQLRSAASQLPRFRLGGDREELTTLPHFFGRVAAAAAVDDLVDLVSSFRPDLVIHEAAELAAPVAAAVHSVPWVTQAWGLPIPGRLAVAVAEAVGPMWEKHGLTVPPHGGLCSYASVEPCPPSLREPAESPYAPFIQPVRHESHTGPVATEIEDRLADLPSRPTVYISFGSAAFGQSYDFITQMASVLADADVNVLITVGPEVQPAQLAAMSAHAEVLPFVPHARLMPLCDAVITHGGSGTVLSAFAAGLPVLVLPQGADQFRMARAVAASGAGVALAGPIARASFVVAADRLVADQSMRERAKRLAEEMAAMPPATTALGSLRRTILNSATTLP